MRSPGVMPSCSVFFFFFILHNLHFLTSDVSQIRLYFLFFIFFVYQTHTEVGILPRFSVRLPPRLSARRYYFSRVKCNIFFSVVECSSRVLEKKPKRFFHLINLEHLTYPIRVLYCVLVFAGSNICCLFRSDAWYEMKIS